MICSICIWLCLRFMSHSLADTARINCNIHFHITARPKFQLGNSIKIGQHRSTFRSPASACLRTPACLPLAHLGCPCSVEAGSKNSISQYRNLFDTLQAVVTYKAAKCPPYSCTLWNCQLSRYLLSQLLGPASASYLKCENPNGFCFASSHSFQSGLLKS